MVETLDVSALPKDYYGDSIRALFEAYGTKYDFCRFYVGGGIVAAIFNSALYICGDTDDSTELEQYISMLAPYEIQLPEKLARRLRLADYVAKERILFAFQMPESIPEGELILNPPVEKALEIIAPAFNIKDKGLWMTDVSHRIRHGVSRLYMMGDTAALMYFLNENRAFFGQIATAACARGKGSGRRFLYKIAEEFSEKGITATLFAKPERISFYEEIGFKRVGGDSLYIRITED